MATIKSFTDLQQSKKLAEILPIESADMCYPKDAFECDYAKEPVCHYSGIGLAHPCWSLAALLGVLPNPNLFEADGLWHIFCDNNISCINGFDNPVDACVAMIEKLNKLKML